MTAMWGVNGIEKCSPSGFEGKLCCSSSSSTPSSKGPCYVFRDILQMAKTIEEHRVKLRTGSSDQQYITFKSVRPSDFEEIEKNWSLIEKNARLSYDEGLTEFIVKVTPSFLHVAAHLGLADDLKFKVWQMGLRRELRNVGSGKFNGKGKSKEGDSAFKPSSRPGEKGWPTIVIESGLLESLSDLRADASFWLNHSAGDVNIVVLISIRLGERKYALEKWELLHQNAVCLQVVKVDLDTRTVVGGPLKLDFQKIFLRPPVGQETDIQFSDPELLDWGETVWTTGYGVASSECSVFARGKG